MHRRPSVLDVAVLCLIGLFGSVLLTLAVGRLLDQDATWVPLSIATVAVVALTVLVWGDGPSARVARVLGLCGLLVAVTAVGAGWVWQLVVGVVLAAELVSQRRRFAA